MNHRLSRSPAALLICLWYMENAEYLIDISRIKSKSIMIICDRKVLDIIIYVGDT